MLNGPVKTSSHSLSFASETLEEAILSHVQVELNCTMLCAWFKRFGRSTLRNAKRDQNSGVGSP